MNYDFDHVPDRRPTDSVRWSQYDPDVLPLTAADMDFPVADPIKQVLRSMVEHGIFGYPIFSKGKTMTALKDVLVERMARRYHWWINPEDILLLPGVIVGLNLTCQAVGLPGESVLVQTPVYPHFLHVAENAGMQRSDALLERHADGYYEVDWDRFEAGITDRTRLFILCNPHNPVGRVYRRDELERMAEICLRHGIVICADEIHCDLIYDGHQHIPIASLDKEIAQNAVTIMAPTKTFNIAGLQCSFAIVQNPKLRHKLESSMRGLVMWVNQLGLAATLAAYRDGQEWLDQALSYLDGNRQFLYATIQSKLPQVEMVKPEGTYLAWLDCHKTGIKGDPCEFFINEGRVALNDGKTFGMGGEGFVRLNFAVTRAVLAQALDRMSQALGRAI